MNNFSSSVYSTPPQITEYLSKHTIHKCVLNKVKDLGSCEFVSLEELLLNLDENLCHELLFNILPTLSVLDPACGAGDFLISALNTLFNIYVAIIDKITFLSASTSVDWLKILGGTHKNLYYFLKKKIIVENLFGVDISEEAVAITCAFSWSLSSVLCKWHSAIFRRIAFSHLDSRRTGR